MFYNIYYFNDYLLFSIQKNFSHSSDPILQKPDWNHLLSICRNPIVLWVFFQISIINIFGFFVIVVASVAERVGFSDGAGFAAGDAQDFSPAVILVFYYSLSGVVNQCNDIILQ